MAEQSKCPRCGGEIAKTERFGKRTELPSNALFKVNRMTISVKVHTCSLGHTWEDYTGH